MTTKINARLFKLLRDKVNRLGYYHQTDYDGYNKAKEEHIRKKLRKMSKSAIVDMIISFNYEGYLLEDFDHSVWRNPYKAKRQQLLKELDHAELMSLAGDNKAALELIETIANEEK